MKKECSSRNTISALKMDNNKSHYSIIQADGKKNRKEIIAIWEKNFPENLSDRYAWIYGDITHRVPIIWFLLDHDNTPVGFASLIIREVKVVSKIVQVGQTVDFVINKEHRSLGPALQLQKTIVKDYPQNNLTFLYGFPNKNSVGVQKRAGLSELGSFERWTKPLRSEYKIREIIPNKILAKVTSSILDVALNIKDALSIKTPQTLQSSTCHHFDERFNALWASASDNISIIGVRDAAYLKWRFNQYPYLHYKTFCIGNRKKLNGYIIYYEKNRMIIISDFIAESKAMLGVLFNSFINKMRADDKNAISLNFCGSTMVTNILKAYGFSKRSHEDKILFYCNKTNGYTKAIHDPASWHITEADRDV